LLAGVVGGAFFSMASHGADQLMVQRYLCARSLGAARLAVVLSGVVIVVQFAFFLLIGVGLYDLAVQDYWPLEPNPNAIHDDEAFVHFITHYLPVGVVGLVSAGVLALGMSSLASSLNSSASASVADFYRPLRPNRSESHYLLVSRVLTLVWGVAQVAIALATGAVLQKRSIVNPVFTVAGFLTGMILGLFLLGSLKKPVRSTAALAGLVGGTAVVCSVWLPSLWGDTVLAWPWLAPIGTMVTVIVALLIDRLFSGSHESKSTAGSSDHGSA
jgi:Na+/proline symporter